MRLIDADNLLKEFERRYRAAIRWKQEAILADNEEIKIRADAVLAFLVEVKLTIEKAPAVNIPLKFVGKWIKTDNRWEMGLWRCSYCDSFYDVKTNYCPTCGAKMKGGE